MLSEFFVAPQRIRAIRNGPAGNLVEGFAQVLFQRGYSEISARRHIRAAEHLMYWADRRSLSVQDLDGQILKQFDEHLGCCRCKHFACAQPAGVLAGARLFLRHVQDVAFPEIRGRQVVTEAPPLLAAFCVWMRERRGTTERSLYNYSLPIRELLSFIGNDPTVLDAACLRQFVLKQSVRGRFIAQRCRTALRMFLRYLIAEGDCRASLLGAIPVVANWRLATLPRCLPPEDIERIISSCDPSTSTGKRDRAIVLLLARLGLRAGDIVAMRLQDIDWKNAVIQVSGKSRRQTQMPMTQEVGQAIATYVQCGRPPALADEVFLRSRAPFRALGSHSAVSVIVASALRRSGVKRPGRGAAHLLRHSVASSMLRGGASLQEISDVLRHRSIETTQIYAKVDVTGLQQIAQPWPETMSC